jgi:molybdenum-dependent DNA-binding transcriptional regulator ModE
MRERILGDKIIELLKKEKEPQSIRNISRKLGTGWTNVYAAVTNLTYFEPIVENDKGGIYLMEHEK